MKMIASRLRRCVAAAVLALAFGARADEPEDAGLALVWEGNAATASRAMSKSVEKGKPFTLIVHMTNAAETAAGSYVISRISSGQVITPFCVASAEYTGFTTAGAIPNDSLAYDEKKSGGWYCGVGSRGGTGSATWAEEKIGEEVAKLASIYVAFSGTVGEDGTVADYVRMVFAHKTSGADYTLADASSSLAVSAALGTMNVNPSVDTLAFKVYLDHTLRDADAILQAIEDLENPSAPEADRLVLGFQMTADNNTMRVGYSLYEGETLLGDVRYDEPFTFNKTSGTQNVWWGKGNNNIGNYQSVLVHNFSGDATWAGYPVVNSNLDGGSGSGAETIAGVSERYWRLDIPFSLASDFTVGQMWPKIFITTASGGTSQPLSKSKRYDCNVEILNADKTAFAAASEVRTDVLGSNVVNSATGALSATLKANTPYVLRVTVDNSSLPGDGCFGGIQGVEFQARQPEEEVALVHRFSFDGTMNSQAGGATPHSTSASYVAGICDQALTFAGNSGSWYADSGMSAGTGNWTVLVVAKTSATEDQVVLALGGKSDANGFGLASAADGGMKAFTWSNGAGAQTVATAAADDATSTYHFYVFAYDAANGKLKWSVDGGAYSEGADYTYANNTKWQIGGIHGGKVGTFANATAGALDELRIYTGQLTAEDIARVMAEFRWPYEAVLAGDVAFAAITNWTQNGAAVAAPTNIATARISLKGRGFVTGLEESPLALALDEEVACDVTACSGTTFSGYGQFLVRAASIAEARTFDTSVRWGVIGGATAAERVTVAAALDVQSVPFYSYGHVKLENATFASGHLQGGNLYVYDVKAMTGNLTLGMATLSKREYQAMPGATVTLDSASEVRVTSQYLLRDSGRAGGFYGQGTFAVAPGRTVYGGYLGIAAKPNYSGESIRRCQYVWTDHGHVGADATLKFTVMDKALDSYLVDMLTRFTVDEGGKITLTMHGESSPFATFASAADGTRFAPDKLMGTPATTRDFETEGTQTMGYQGLFTNAVRVANFGYDTGFISALVDAAHAQVADAVPAEPYAVSLYADLGALDGTDILTIGDPAVRAIRLRVGEGLLQLVEVTGADVRETGVVAARGIGFHLFTISKSAKGAALYADGKLAGTDLAFTSAVSGPVAVGAGVSLRMFRIDDVLLSDELVAALARMWPVNETTTPSVQATDSILNQIRMSSAWAAEHLPERVVTNLFNHEAIKADDEITGKAEERQQRLEEYQSELEKLGRNGLPLWQSYLQGLDPDDPDKTHARPYVNEVRFERDPVDSAVSNTVVELSYADPARNSGINVTYHLAARDAAGSARRNVPVLGGSATLAGDDRPADYKPKAQIQPRRPNIIFVLADDLGYGDVGWTVQNARKANGQIYISTPHMDQMVREGCELTAHYAAAPVCAPSRASILTGKHQGACSLRDNSFDCPILEERTIGTVMREHGYVTHAIGKWGVGGGGESGLPMIAHPLDRGFDHFYGFLDHGAGHTYYHYDGLLNGAYMGIVEDRERKTETAVGLYSTDLLMARAKKVLVDQVAENRRTGTEKPVFMYLAINAMHGSGGDKLDASVPNKVNLHVPGRAFPDANPATEKKFGVGEGLDWDWLQANREPVGDRNTYIYDYAKGYGQAPSRYATTITRLDDAMEDLKQTVIDLGIADNTIIVFTSDNGPTNEYGTNKDTFDSNGEFQQGKRSCMEGGLREPTFIWAPGYIPAGSKDNRPSMNHSWMRFFEEVAKSDTAPQMCNEVYSEYAYGGSQIMVRIGDYVGVNTAVGSCTLDTISLAIYNVVTDPGQTNNIASTSLGQSLLPRMRELMKGYHSLWLRPGGYGNGDGQKQTVRPYDN